MQKIKPTKPTKPTRPTKITGKKRNQNKQTILNQPKYNNRKVWMDKDDKKEVTNKVIQKFKCKIQDAQNDNPNNPNINKTDYCFPDNTNVEETVEYIVECIKDIYTRDIRNIKINENTPQDVIKQRNKDYESKFQQMKQKAQEKTEKTKHLKQIQTEQKEVKDLTDEQMEIIKSNTIGQIVTDEKRNDVGKIARVEFKDNDMIVFVQMDNGKIVTFKAQPPPVPKTTT